MSSVFQAGVEQYQLLPLFLMALAYVHPAAKIVLKYITAPATSTPKVRGR